MARPYRLFWLLVLAFHAVAATGALWLLPGGFPVGHPRFWSNWVAPFVLLVAVISAFSASRSHRSDRLGTILLAFPVAWAAGAISSRILFPVTFRWIFLVPLAVAAVMAGVWILTFRRSVTAGGVLWGVVLVAGLFGGLLPFTQRAPDPDTRPLGALMPELVSGQSSTTVNGGMLSLRLSYSPGDGSVRVKAGALSVDIRSLLTFISRSPDGCSTILAPPDLREGPGLHLRSSQRDEDGVRMWYRADYDASLSIEPGGDGRPIVLESYANLPVPIFSHLNSFCDLDVSGHKKLALSFSPCPEAIIDVLPADYPVGRPLRLAYRDAQERFHVVEATSGEKGPYRELASGRLTRLQSLGITLHDQGKPVVTLIMDDWAAQTGTAPSPTAGWGVPVNAIEFSLSGDAPTSPAGIYLTLAGTSVGRGWDSVGHAEGAYRNRITVEFTGSETNRDK